VLPVLPPDGWKIGDEEKRGDGARISVPRGHVLSSVVSDEGGREVHVSYVLLVGIKMADDLDRFYINSF
jgi:hypothetical protein